jgi:CRP-like cAMP-binding protein
MIVDQEQLRFLKRNTLFKEASETYLNLIIKPKNFFKVKEGEVIYSCGEEAFGLYLILMGEIKIKFCNERKKEHRFNRRYLTDFFGESEVLDESKRNSSAVADKDCVLYKISSTELKSLISANQTLYNNLKKKEEIENDEFQEIVKSENLTPEDLNSAVDEELNCLREKQMAKHELDNLSAETNISPNNENPASGCIENSDDQGELKLE